MLFSGDAFNPSLMSSLTKGEQMPPVLNACGIRAAVVGNHDLDFGRPRLAELISKCNFPWLMSNVLDVHTGEPFDGCQRYAAAPSVCPRSRKRRSNTHWWRRRFNKLRVVLSIG